MRPMGPHGTYGLAANWLRFPSILPSVICHLSFVIPLGAYHLAEAGVL